VRIVLAGAGGGLGRAFIGALEGSQHELRPFTHAELDIGDPGAVANAVAPLRPEVIVNAAAFTGVDACETDVERAMRDNAQGPEFLAMAALETGAVLVHVSTDYVFDGEKGSPYDERDAPNPISEYGRSKFAGEEAVRALLDRHVIVRTGLVFGGGTDYLSGSLRRLANGETAGGLVDRMGSPTFVRHLAARLLPLAESGWFGTVHVGGPEATTWNRVLKRAKALEPERLTGEVVEQRFDELGLPAARPLNSSLTSVVLPELADRVPAMPPLDDALRELIALVTSA
jgi:dTDP-4-dehydrorhamnose reductase